MQFKSFKVLNSGKRIKKTAVLVAFFYFISMLPALAEIEAPPQKNLSLEEAKSLGIKIEASDLDYIFVKLQMPEKFLCDTEKILVTIFDESSIVFSSSIRSLNYQQMDGQPLDRIFTFLVGRNLLGKTRVDVVCTKASRAGYSAYLFNLKELARDIQLHD
jgi:hypothetical protein